MTIERSDRRMVRILPKGGEQGAGGVVQAEHSRLPFRSPAHPPEVRFQAPGEVEVLVKFRPEAFANLLAHCDQSNEHGREICGLLLGKPSQLDNSHFQGYLLIVTDILPLEAPDASGAHVSAGPETWVWAEAQIEARFEGKERLGWYHTHPTQGIFFSGADKDFHSIFTRPFQFALVVDPRVPEVSLFHWQDRLSGEIAGPFPLGRGKAPLLRAGFRKLRLFKGDQRLPLLLPSLAGFAGLCMGALLLSLFSFEDRPVTLQPAELPLATAQITEPQASQEPPPPAQAPTTVRPAEEKEDSTPEQPKPQTRVSRNVLIWERKSGVVFLFGDSSKRERIDYVPNPGGWYETSVGQEPSLLRYLLDLEEPGLDDVKRLQAAVGITQPTGDWRSQSRAALIQTALQQGNSGKRLEVRSHERVLSITFQIAESKDRDR